LQVFQQAEVGIRVSMGVKLLERYQEIQVTMGGVKARPGCGTEQLDTPHLVAAADDLYFSALFFDQTVDAVTPAEDSTN